MKIHLAFVSGRGTRSKLPGIQETAKEFAGRLARYTQFELHEFSSEAALLQSVGKLAGRATPVLVILDVQGKALSSEEIGAYIAAQQQRGTQHLVFAIGGADGWTPRGRSQADLLLSLGNITLPHELARVVVLEQLYRAFTILKGHPYHRGGS